MSVIWSKKYCSLVYAIFFILIKH